MIEILDENLKKVDILRKYTFVQYNDKFREVGTFKINARIVQENLYLLDRTKEFYVLFDGTVFGKVENVKRESDSEYEQTIVLSGRLGLLLFTKRVIAGTIKFKGNTAQFVKDVIYNEIVKDQRSKRYVNIDIQYDDETYLTSFCSLIDKQVTGGYVWDSVQSVLEQDKLGLYFVPIVETEHIPSWGTEPTNISKWKLTISAGKDRTKGNTKGNVPVVFSQSLSNIARTDYELDTQKYCNVAYVAGEGEEEQRKWYEVYAKEETARGIEGKTGWKRNELWIDARDIQSTDEEGNEIAEAEYETLIKQRADEKFTDNAVEESYTATLTEANKQYTYGVDYILGDLVTVIDDELGISIDVQITGVTKSTEGVREIVDIDFTYGKVNRDPTEQIKNIGGLIEKNNNDIVYIENKIKDIGNNVETINNNLTVNEYSYNDFYFNSFYQILQFQCYRLGRMVFLNMELYVNPGTVIIANTTYGFTYDSIPEEIKPKNNVILQGFCCDGDFGNATQISAYINIGNGRIEYSTPVSKSYFAVQGFWLV